MTAADPRAGLRADCSRCAGLCCVAPAFTASADFAIDKPAGRPCRHLQGDSGCGIHGELRERGFPGCAVFDCFGAGQHVVQELFAGADWRSAPASAEAMFGVFPVVRQAQELRWYLLEALERLPEGELRDEVARADSEVALLLRGSVSELRALDPVAQRREAGALLERVSGQLRSGFRRPADRRGADLVGARLRGVRLAGASLRGAYLLGADLRGADLSLADLLGADLRGADVRGARLVRSIFLTQPQLDAARGDAATTIPAVLLRPRHWPGGEAGGAAATS